MEAEGTSEMAFRTRCSLQPCPIVSNTAEGLLGTLKRPFRVGDKDYFVVDNPHHGTVAPVPRKLARRPRLDTRGVGAAQVPRRPWERPVPGGDVAPGHRAPRPFIALRLFWIAAGLGPLAVLTESDRYRSEAR